MDFDDDFDSGYGSDPVESGSGYDLSDDQGISERNLDPLNYRDPKNAYFFLSDDVQNELGNRQNRKLKCLLCGHEFLGRKTDQCPLCYGTQFSEIR